MQDITVRKVKFEFPDELDDILPGDDFVAETYRVGFSLTMPYLEPYLIRTYRALVDDISDPDLAADVKNFIGQEAQHFQNHRRVNEMIKEQLGTEVASQLNAIEKALDADYRHFSDVKSRRFNLVYAEGFEAMTCAMSISAFEEAAAGNGSDRLGKWQELYAWHAAEEIEHRTVAFDVYKYFDGSYPYRVAGSLRAQTHFHRYVDRFQRVLLRAQGQSARPRRPPALGAPRSLYLRTFKPSYNPADIEAPPLSSMVLANYA